MQFDWVLNVFAKPLLYIESDTKVIILDLFLLGA